MNPIKATITGIIIITECESKASEAMKRALELKNPTYEQAIRTNPRARYALSPYIKYWQMDDNGNLVLPRGMLGRLQEYAAKIGTELVLDDQRVMPRIIRKLGHSITLRPYQEGVTDIALEQVQGTLELDTGFGKTLIGCELAHKLGLKTLIIVPKIDLLNQWQNEIKKFLPEYTVGVINAGQLVLGDITVATMQTLSRRVADGLIDPSAFGLVLADECHSFVSVIARKTIGHFKAKYRYGLTATARRTDEQGEAIHFIFGETLVKRKVERAQPHVVVVKNEEHIFVEEYADMILAQTTSTIRNNLIVSVIDEELNSGRRILVLTKRVEHYKLLKEMLHGEDIYTLDSDMKRQDRDELLKKLKVEPFKVLLGTMPLLSTGIDIPSLDTLVFAGDLKSDVLTEQAAGRILRLFEGKQHPRIIDIHDVNNGILKRQGNLRQKFYKENGWQIIQYND